MEIPLLDAGLKKLYEIALTLRSNLMKIRKEIRLIEKHNYLIKLSCNNFNLFERFSRMIKIPDRYLSMEFYNKIENRYCDNLI